MENVDKLRNYLDAIPKAVTGFDCFGRFIQLKCALFYLL